MLLTYLAGFFAILTGSLYAIGRRQTAVAQAANIEGVDRR
jgi:hypothetical protein